MSSHHLLVQLMGISTASQVFKVAKALAPSVIYIDEVEKVRLSVTALACMRSLHVSTLATSRSCGALLPKTMLACPRQVFIMDKKKARTFGGVEPFNRIRKQLVKEVRLGTLDPPSINEHQQQR